MFFSFLFWDTGAARCFGGLFFLDQKTGFWSSLSVGMLRTFSNVVIRRSPGSVCFLDGTILCVDVAPSEEEEKKCQKIVAGVSAPLNSFILNKMTLSDELGLKTN